MVKGPVTYLSDGEQTVRMAHGTPALAKAGTGDVLAGMTAALLAQGLDPFEASVLGAELHARAGLAAAARWSTIAATAEDVVACIPDAIAELVSASSYGTIDASPDGEAYHRERSPAPPADPLSSRPSVP